MAASSKLTLAQKPMKKAMVVSHERSGTHFLMNTLDKNFEYIGCPWINFDFELGLNFHSARNILQFFQKLHDQPVLNVIKSHHQCAFFAKLLSYLTEQFHIFYIYRDPRDVMLSFHRLINHFQWDEGPRVNRIGDFIRAQPRGAILRYQKEQTPTMLHRWQDHVEGWYNYSLTDKGKNLILIKFEDLNLRFEETVKYIGERIGQPVTDPRRPSSRENVIYTGKGVVGGHKEHFTPQDYEFVQKTVTKTMQRLNIDW